MKCLEDPEKQKQVEKELHKLLSQATFILPLCITCRSIGDTSSIITYIMVFLNQMPGDITTLRSTLKKETNVFLQSGSGILASLGIDTDRIIDSLFAFIETLEDDKTVPDTNVDHIDDANEEEETKPEPPSTVSDITVFSSRLG